MFIRTVKRFWPQIFIFIVIFAFFYRLFFPPSTFVNPDFGRTDILHIALPQKFILANSLKEFRLPLWEFNAGQGFPLYSEMIGTFFLPNLVFLLLPFKLAIPSIFLITFLTAAWGMYFLLIRLKLEKFISLLGAISFAFSAAMILRVQHLGIAQGISFLPWALKFFIDFLNKPRVKTLVIVAIIFTMILFAFVQIFVYTVILLFLLGIIYSLLENKKKVYIFLISFSILMCLTAALSAIQIIPTYELVKQSQREGGVDPNSILTGFPLLPKNLLTFLDPFIVGKASNGTYNSIDWTKEGIYWENTSYIGLAPFIFALIAIGYLILKRPKNIFSYITVVVFTSTLLALGGLSPLHILFSFPPFDYFRVPARFIMFTQFFAVILGAYGLNIISGKFPKKYRNYIFASILLITIADLYIRWWNYNPIGKIDDWLLKKPETIANLNSSLIQNYRVYTIDSYKNWNDIFLKYGWENKLDYYKFFLNSLEPDYNLFFGVNHLSSYQVLPTRRQNLQQSIIPQNTKISNDFVEFNKTAQKALNLFSIKYLVSSVPIKNENYQKIFQTNKGNYKYIVYENKNAQSLINFYYDYQKVDTIGDYLASFEKIDPKKTVLLENDLGETFRKGRNSIESVKKGDSSLSLKVSTQTDGILVFSDSFYPGWEAKIDSKVTKIYPADINSKAIVVPAGEHKVEFTYKPKSILIGGLISLIALLVSLKILLKKN